MRSSPWRPISRKEPFALIVAFASAVLASASAAPLPIETTLDGFIIGSFTEVVNAVCGAESKGRVHFFRIAVLPDAPKIPKR